MCEVKDTNSPHSLNMYLVKINAVWNQRFGKKINGLFLRSQRYCTVIYLMWPSCREDVPWRHRLGLLANWNDLTREICGLRWGLGGNVWDSLCPLC